MTDKARLIQLLRECSFRYQPAAPFTLASGRTSPYYFNCKTTLYHPEGMRVVGKRLFPAMRDPRPAAVGGLTLGADSLAYACAYTSYLEGQPVEVVGVPVTALVTRDEAMAVRRAGA